MSPIKTAAYLADDTYNTMLDDLANALVNPGPCLRSRLIEVLGDADIWPIMCLEDRLEERQRRRARGLEM
ncbi:hypothetical protein J2W99_005084 [Bosea robiniae]|uniref:hypothetical protein n=1 Tax=Bosea TaxID=85413 RepID=UPI002862BEC4|nr:MULTISPECIES: hypothetical protein [Bosea]MDR6831331.1 hypothetical protein [Bosea robiniae]MDR6898101.1 hypothetical protein [Bosea sp. BE109]MDR7141468.1 hypothetical protein [Bosea sp. BE168]